MQVQPLGWEYPLEKEIATHSSVLAWKFPWTASFWRMLVGYSPWGCKELDMIEQLHFHFEKYVYSVFLSILKPDCLDLLLLFAIELYEFLYTLDIIFYQIYYLEIFSLIPCFPFHLLMVSFAVQKLFNLRLSHLFLLLLL